MPPESGGIAGSRPALVATVTDLSDLERCADALSRADWVEVRADLVGADVSAAAVRDRFDGGVLYTLRSVAEGGGCDRPAAERRRLLERAARSWDLVDVELETDCGDGAPEVPTARRVVSWHGRFGEPRGLPALEALLERQRGVGGRFLKIVAAAESPSEALPALLLQARNAGRGDVTAFAMGACATWTRVLAARRGAALTYGSAGGDAAAPGQLSIDRLLVDYRLDRPVTPGRLFAILGEPLGHSLSPRLHNNAYADAGLDAAFVAVEGPFDEAWSVLRSDELAAAGFDFAGCAVTTPHKDAALRAGHATRRARAVTAANTLVRAAPPDDGWVADSTDAEGVVGPLRHRGVDLDAPCAVLGAGGAGRAAAWGLAEAGAAVTLVNRSVERGRAAAADLGVRFEPLADFDPAAFGVVVHATALGHGEGDPLPFDPQTLRPGSVVVDMVYRPGTVTPLVAATRHAGQTAIDGREVLLHQAVAQFRRMNGVELDPERSGARLGLGDGERTSASGSARGGEAS